MPHSSKTTTTNSLEARIFIPSKNQWTTIDAIHEEEVKKYTWGIHVSGFAVTYLTKGGRRRSIYLHRLILRLEGISISKRHVTHVDGNKLNNLVSNLVPTTSAELSFYSHTRSNNTTGYKGVYYRPKAGINPWCAHIGMAGDQVFLGGFSTAEKAAMAYNEALRNRKDVRERFKIYNDV